MLSLAQDAGLFERLRARAEHKRAAVAALVELPDVEEFSELQLLELRDWYFSRVANADMPDDLERWVREAGYSGVAELHRALFAEYLYREVCGGPPTGGTYADDGSC
jgi:hypothetical protein